MEELDKRRSNKDKGRADRSTGIKRRSLAIFLACMTFIVIAMARQSNTLTADHIPDFAQRIELATGKNYHSITTQKRTDEPHQVSSDSREESLDLLFPERFDMPFVVAGNGVQVTMRNLGVSPSRLQVVLDPSSGDGKGEFIYKAVYPHTDSRHRVEQGRSEEFLYLHNELAPTTFEYELTQIEGADLVSLQGGAIIFSRGGVPNLQIEAPWVIDATGRRSEDAVRWKLEPADQQGRRRLQLSLDPTGLQYPLTVDPSWSVVAAMTVARGNPRSIRLPDGKIMVTGSGTSVQLYDPATGVWSATGSLNTGRTQQSLTLLSDGRVLVAGGSSSGTTLTSCEIYNPSTGTWSLTGSLNHNRLDHRAVLLTDGRVLVIGGYNWPVVGSLLEYPDMVEIYDPVAGTWSSPGTTTPRIYHQVVLLNDGKVLVVGGYNNTTGATTTPQIYDPATNVWSNAGTIHNTMDPSATLLTDGKVLVTGGRTSGASGIDSAIRTSIIYDPVAGTWSNTGLLNNKRAAHTATRLLNGNVLVTGGESPVNTSLSTTEIYDPIAGTWSSAGSMSTPRRFHAASLLSYGAVLIMGGTNGSSTQLTSVELYGDPNQTPTITAASGLTRMAGASGSNSTIATVTDAETASGSLTVTVTTANPANGVTISNIANSSGTITADIVAATGASYAIFTLQVSDGTATATARLNVAVTSLPPVTFDNNPPVNPQDGQADFRPGSVVALTQTLR
ncbi:MAG: kelch repeat-containing protein, partial [Acidobacteriota bacterium]